MTTLCRLGIHARLLAALLTCATVAASRSQEVDLSAIEKQGIFYQNDQQRQGPWSIHYVRIDRTRPDLELTASKARGRVIGLDRLSSQLSALPPEAGRPLAAINGDFYQTESSPYMGDPRGLMIVRGELLSAPSSSNTCFWIDAGGQPHIDKVASGFKVTWPDGKTTLFGLNEARGSDTAVLYTPSLGRSTLTRNGRELVLEKNGPGPWLPLEIGRTYSARVREAGATNNTVIAKDTLVLSLGPRLLNQVPAIKAGDVLQLSTATTPALVNVKTAIGGGPKLVHEGKATPPEKIDPLPRNMPYAVRALYERHPRSAVGFNKTNFFFVEVDGRQPGLSVGMTLEELADYLAKLGCTEAMNLDGGASSGLVVDGRVMNKPSSGFERNTATGLVVVQRKSN